VWEQLLVGALPSGKETAQPTAAGAARVGRAFELHHSPSLVSPPHGRPASSAHTASSPSSRRPGGSAPPTRMRRSGEGHTTLHPPGRRPQKLPTGPPARAGHRYRRVVRSDSGGGGRGGGSCRPGYVHPAGNRGLSRGQPNRGGIEQPHASATFGKKRCTGHDRCRDRARLARSRSGIPYARYPLWPQSPADGLLFGCIGLPLSGHSVDDHRRLRRLEAQVSDALPDGDLRAERLGEPLQT
jgi:hypothetical protein